MATLNQADATIEGVYQAVQSNYQYHQTLYKQQYQRIVSLLAFAWTGLICTVNTYYLINLSYLAHILCGVSVLSFLAATLLLLFLYKGHPIRCIWFDPVTDENCELYRCSISSLQFSFTQTLIQCVTELSDHRERRQKRLKIANPILMAGVTLYVIAMMI